MRKTLLAALIAASLAACGGGGDAAPEVKPVSLGRVQQVALYGDSLTAGVGLTVKPAERMQSALVGMHITDYSVPGMIASQQGPMDQADTVAILYGGADVVNMTDPEKFEVTLRKLVAEAQGAGSRVVLATVIKEPAYGEREEIINAIIRHVAVDTGAALADAFTIPVGAFVDAIHPDQVWSDARTALIVQAIK